MNPRAKTRHMKPSGSNRPDVYILGEAPGMQEDEDGKPFVGPSGRWLRQFIPEGTRIRFNNVCRTLPIARGQDNSRKPTQHEIECYRPSVEADIEQTRPRAIIGTGGVPFRWAFGLHDNIISARGRRFPIRVGKHACWFYPVLHPAFVLRSRDSKEPVKYGEGDQKVPGKEIERIAEHDMRRAIREALRVDPPDLEDLDTLFDGVEVEYKDPYKVREFLFDCWREESLVGIDLECNELRPYDKKNKAPFKVLSCAISTKTRTLAFPIDHPQSQWTADDRGLILAELKRLLLHPDIRKTVHNLLYDLEILVWLFNEPKMLNTQWECSQRQAYVIDERRGCQSLNALTQMHFGFKIKEFSDVDRMALERTPLKEVLPYNGLDAKFHRRVYLRQKRLLKDVGRQELYEEHVQRVPSLVMMQRTGMPVSQPVVEELQGGLQLKIDKALADIFAQKVVGRYEERFGKYNPRSDPDNIRMFRDVLQRKEGDRGKRYSTDDESLSQMKDIPLAALVLALRRWNKLKGTYIDRLDKGHEKSYVYADGRMHAQFKDTGTDTGRLSCEDPNMQNWPKRKDADIRRAIVAACAELEEQYGEGPLVLISTDYGQIEYRVIGMASLDKVIVDSCWSEYDVHAYWAEKIIKAYDKTYNERHGHIEDPKKRFKAFRGDVKNQFVFPFFFKAGYRSISGNLEMPERLLRPIYEEAQEEFKGVTKWQNKVIRDYENTLEVSSLIGRVRHGPMSVNMVVNSGIQSFAADLNVNALNRLRRKAIATDRHWLAPVAQIHDDLTFIVPKRKVDEAIPIIVKTMCKVPFECAHVVPITAEVSIGKDWASMKEYGTFRSDKLDLQLAERKMVA
jgi:uracil-DNA glycosylase family 4